MFDQRVWWLTACKWCKSDEAKNCDDPVCRGRAYGEVHTDECPALTGPLSDCTCLEGAKV